MVLRQLKGHGRPVRCVRYAPQDKIHLLSGSDDSMVKWWDVTTQEELLSLEGHKDYVRCGAVSPSSANWATGSYDHTVRLWDLRNSKTVLQLQHGKPLEDVLFFPSGGLLATAGGSIVKVWDILGGGRLIHHMESHQKTVMSMCISKVIKSGQSLVDAPSRLVTASLDGYMKVFDLDHFKCIIAVMEELVARNRLMRCVSNLNAEEFEMLIRFLYSSHIVLLRSRVIQELQVQKSLQELQGIIEPLIRASAR